MEHNAVGWFEIYVQDMPRARQFYETVLQVKLDQLPTEGIEMWAFPMGEDRPGIPGALACMEGMPSGSNSIVIYFICEDCAVEAGRVGAAGGSVVYEKKSIGDHGFIAVINDTEGNMIGLHSPQ